MNTELLLRIKEHILAKPQEFIMFVMESDAIAKERHCGTAACIAGWACLLSGKQTSWTAGARLLGLRFNEQYRLFDQASWPRRFAEPFMDNGSIRDANLAAARIDHFIATDGRE